MNENDKESEEDIRRRVIGYCLVCGSDELLVLEGLVKCLACNQTYTVEYFLVHLKNKWRA